MKKAQAHAPGLYRVTTSCGHSKNVLDELHPARDPRQRLEPFELWRVGNQAQSGAADNDHHATGATRVVTPLAILRQRLWRNVAPLPMQRVRGQYRFNEPGLV